MKCLEKLVGVRGKDCNYKGYIDDLPGIHIKKAAKVVSDPDVFTGYNLLKKSITVAIPSVVDDVLIGLNAHHIFSTVHEAETIGSLTGDMTLYPSGVDIEVATLKTDFDCKNLIGCVSRIYLKADRNVCGKIIFSSCGEDREQDIELKENCTVAIDLGHEYIDEATIKIRLCEDASLVGGGCSSSCHCHDSCVSASFNMGAKIDHQCLCDKYRFACTIAKMLVEPLKYRAGVHFMDEVYNSERINEFVIYGQEKALENRAIWLKDYNKLIKGVVDSLKGSLCGPCFKQNGPVLKYSL